MPNDIKRDVQVEPLKTVLADARKTHYTPDVISVRSETTAELSGIRLAIVDRFGAHIESPTLNIKALVACIESVYECRKALASVLCYAEGDSEFADSEGAELADKAYQNLPLH